MGKLNNKRKRVLIVVLAAVIGNAIVTSTPTLNIENSKNIFLTFANVVMFLMVWDTYFDEKISQKGVLSFLQDLLSITLVSLITTFIISKVITKNINNLIAILGSLGWLIAGLIAGGVTGILGIGWALYCDDLYRNST
ncbi:hypothetical protein [Pleurocapsa sp. PCC 7319]|uniref:hypothetical protein n=1 Tax=Pleurocapsa sp. PCC 7319 TaxID=118161 RepID=UPI00034BD668|nr:hypothetical protein [Pleurocapsa sp. PCC 7319]